MATVVCLLNPEVVLVDGALASSPLLAGIRETLYRSALPRATRHMTLQLGSLGEDAAVVGSHPAGGRPRVLAPGGDEPAPGVIRAWCPGAWRWWSLGDSNP